MFQQVTLSLNILIILVTLLLAYFVYRSNKKSATNVLFTLLSFVTAFWLIAMYFSYNNYIPEKYTLFLMRVSIFFAVPQSILFYFLSITLPEKNIPLKGKSIFFIVIFAVFLMLFTLSDNVFKEIYYINGYPRPVINWGILLFAFFVVSFSFVAILSLIKKFFKSKNIVRKQFLFILLGILLMLGLIIVTILLPVLLSFSSPLVSLSPLYAFIFLFMTAISISKYHLLDLKIIVTELFVSLLSVILIFEGFLSGSLLQIIYKILFAFLILGIGYFLVKSVKKEIEQREELAVLAHNLEKANLRLQELDQQKTEFLSIASHQLRTPLSIIRGYIELIGDGAYGKVSKGLRETLGNMDESNDRLMKLVEEFLDITRIEQGRTKFVFAENSLNDTITSVVKELSMKSEVSEKKLKISWKPEKNIDKIIMDEEKIRHVVFNFLDNAIKYSDKGIIKISLETEDNGYTVRVKDQGFGFNKEDEVNFFQKFYRGKNVEGTNVNGTGLGIYVCRKFIEKHGGHVWAHSEGLGKGSEFGFWVPGVKLEE